MRRAFAFLPLFLVVVTALGWLACSDHVSAVLCGANHACPAGATCDIATNHCLAATDGGVMACSLSSDCPATDPVCAGGHCGACATSDGGASAECMADFPATPLCGAAGGCAECLTGIDCLAKKQGCIKGLCAPCVQNADCGSGVCTSGVCADPANLLYVSASGPHCPAGPGAGSFADPFCKVQAGFDAAAAAHKTLVIRAGTYAESLSVAPGAGGSYVVTAVGIGGPVIQGGVNPTLNMNLSGGTRLGISLDGVTLANGGQGVSCLGASGNVGATTLVLTNSTVRSAAMYGLSVQMCDLTMNRDVVGPGNAGGGMLILDSDFSITNTLVRDNGAGGASGSGYGGIFASGSSARANLINVTVVDNSVKDGLSVPSGLACPSGVTAFNVVLFGNGGGNGEIDSSGCAPQYSAWKGAANTNHNRDLATCQAAQLFVDAANSDYHPARGGAASCTLIDDGTDRVGAVNAPSDDLDGVSRPQGAAYDIGAYEAQ